MQRYAVVSDIDSPDYRRVGLVVERADRVNLLLSTDFGLRSEFRDPYTVTEPDGSEIVYHPGRPEYFDHVLLTLARAFLVVQTGAVEHLDTVGVMNLFHDEVLTQQPRSAPSEYPCRAPLRMLPTASPTSLQRGPNRRPTPAPHGSFRAA